MTIYFCEILSFIYMIFKEHQHYTCTKLINIRNLQQKLICKSITDVHNIFFCTYKLKYNYGMTNYLRFYA